MQYLTTMTHLKYTEGPYPFFSGPKKQAKYLGQYIDLDNVLGRNEFNKPKMTPGNFYKILSEGECYNPQNAFRNYFPMIMIKDDNGNVFGFDTNLFDFTDAYTSDYDLSLRQNKAETLFSENPEIIEDTSHRTSNSQIDEIDHFEDDPVSPYIPDYSIYEEKVLSLSAKFDNNEEVSNLKNPDLVLKALKNKPNNALLIMLNFTLEEFRFYELKNNMLYSEGNLVLQDKKHLDFLKGETQGVIFYNQPVLDKKETTATTTKIDSEPSKKTFSEVKSMIQYQEQFHVNKHIYVINHIKKEDLGFILSQFSNDDALFVGIETLACFVSKSHNKLKCMNLFNLKETGNGLPIEDNFDFWQSNPNFYAIIVSTVELNCPGLIKKNNQ